MNSFSGEPEFKYIGNGQVEMLEDFTYTPPKKYGYKPVIVPIGFKSDLMSVPPIVRWFIHKYGDTMYGALPHDYLYYLVDRPRKEADHIFLLALEDVNDLIGHRVPWLKRLVAYRGVRIGGWVPWNKRKKMLEKEHV